MAENNNVTGSVVGKVRFTIDKASWDNLDKFQKKLTSVKKQMSGMDKTIKVQAVVSSINKVTNAVVKSEKAITKSREESARRMKKSGAGGVGLEFGKATGSNKDYANWWKDALSTREKAAKEMLAIEKRAWRENEQFDKQKQRAYESRRRNVQGRWDKRKASRLKAGGKLSSNMSTFDARVEAFRMVKEGQLERTKTMRGWSDAELTAAKDRLYKTIDSSRKQYTGANAGDIQLLRAEVNNVVRGMQTMDAVARKNAITFRSLRNEIVQMTAAFTAFTVAQNIAQTGFEFESLRASARVFAKDDAGVAEHMAFISEQAHRLGLDLATATKEFTKFSIATQSNMSKKDQRDLFISMSEYSRVLGLSKQDYERAFRAVQQMASKGQVYKEELTGQLGEAMGGSVQAMMRAAGYTNEKDFFKAIEAGKVLSKDVLPKFAKELHKLSMSGGALEKTMQSTPAQFQRFMTALTEAKLAFYDNGMNKGLAYMFKEMADLLQELTPLSEAFGNMFRGAISAVTAAVKVLAIPMRVIVRIFESFSNILKELGVEDGTGMLWRLVGAGGVLALMASRFGFITKAVWTLNTALLTTLARLAPFIAAYAALEDVFLYMKHGDNVNSVTGTVMKGLKQSSNMGVGEIMQNMWAGYSRNSPLAMMGLIPEYTPTVEITVKDGEFSKAIDAKLQKKTATTQSEIAQ